MTQQVVNRRIRLLLLADRRRRFARAARARGVDPGRARRRRSRRSRSAAPGQRSSCRRAAGRSSTAWASPLALGEQATTVYADPRQITHPRSETRTVAARMLDLEAAAAGPAARRPHARVRLRRAEGAAGATRPRSRRRSSSASASTPEERRVYPQSSVAAQVLGYAGVDNNGLAGLELQLNNALDRQPGGRRSSAIRRARRSTRSENRQPARDGKRRLPHARPHDPGERGAGAALRRFGSWHAKAATAIVLDPQHRRRARDGDRAELRRERFPAAARGVQRTAPSPTCTSRARCSSS